MVFVYTSLQIIIYFGGIVAVLYYYGIIQAALSRVAFVMHHTIGTTCAESLNAAACIFLGQTEAALLIEPALATMTESEIHSVMTAGFACIAGSLFAAYISFGACPAYLLSATVMSAAASLASKEFKFAEIESNSVLECLTNGLATLARLTFNKIHLILLDPQVEFDETMKVAELMGIKTVLNEFIAYKKLSEMITEKTLNGARAKMIATYALCGFSNISMIGGQIAILSAMCPQKKSIFAKQAVRALISGIITCFITTCVAGMIIASPLECPPVVGQDHCLSLAAVRHIFNTTNVQL
uniref:Concentrative nucleoside transporter C-terminal domain-containing protein n=1 Tax=Ditylenchus dipsaci TaxID=166011 RepID=A0A915EBI3_9BILA